MTETRPAVSAPFELRARVASSAIIVLSVVLAIRAPTPLFALAVTAAAILALREWHRLVNGNLEARETFLSGFAVVAAVLLFLNYVAPPTALVAIFGGALLTAISAGLRRTWVLWHGFGVLYIGLPTIALVALHAWKGGLAVGGIFAVVWAADTAALFIGRALGGPRLAPTLSPNKTWSGLIGGVLAAGLAEAAYVALIGSWFGKGSSQNIPGAALLGISLAIAAACGDLFESWVKRRCQAKNSGSLIPGHGGMLDRIDSLLFAAPAGAAFVFLSGVDYFGAGR